MPLRGANIRYAYESFCNGSASFRGHTGPQGFVRCLRNDLGLTVDAYQRPRVAESLRDSTGRTAPRIRPEEISLRELATAMCGESWVEWLDPRNQGFLAAEADGAAGAIAPGNIPNVSAYLGSVSGLLEAKILEAYQKPEYIADQLVEIIQTNLRQTKMIGVGRIGNRRVQMTPGEAHPRAQFGERYVTTPETEYFGLAVDVTKHAVFFDQTTQVLERAESVGDELALGKELDVMAVVSGATNPYIYNGTAYNTYLTSGNWVNDQSNPLVDWTDLNLARELFGRMTDQETRNRIVVTPDVLLVSPSKEETAHQIMQATTYQQRTNSQAEVREGANRERARYTVMSSPYMDQHLTTAAASGGLGLSQSNANDYWWMFQKSKAFIWCENWGITTKKASPSDYVMTDQNLVLSVFSNYMGVASVREPRAVVRNKN